MEVADRFDCNGLKVLPELALVKSGIEKDNVPELLLFADAHNCALLKEAALSCIVGNM